MTYVTGEEAKKGDVIMGKVDGVPARGSVVLVMNESGEKVKLQRRAPAQFDERRRLMPARIQQDVVSTADFSLVYRDSDE